MAIESGICQSRYKITNVSQLDDQLANWHSQVISLLDHHAPYRSFPRKNNSISTNKLTRELIKQRNTLANKIKKANSSSIIGPLTDQVKILNKRIKSRNRATLKSNANIAMSTHNTKDTWRFINKAMFRQPKQSNSAHLPNVAKLSNYFSDLVTDNCCTDPPSNILDHNLLADELQTSDSQFSLTPINIYTTYNLLRNIKADTATGHDDIPAKFLKRWAPFLAYNIMILFNFSIAINAFPSSWKMANVTAVYKKKGSRSEVENYRAISVLPVLGRLLERTVAIQLQSYCNAHNIIPIQQFGFRKFSSCELAVLAALDTWQEEVSRGNLVGTLLIDLSKDFDSISHSKLILELSSIGMDRQSLEWFKSFLSIRFQRLVVNETYSPWQPVTKGVPQGSSLSPLLFNIFVRHIPSFCDGHAFQFADDLTNSVAAADPLTLSSKLQASYSKIKSFFDERNLTINLSKTQLMGFKPPNKHLPNDYTITLDGLALPPSPSVLMLGVVVDHHFTMAAHILMLNKKCHGLLGVLRRAAAYLPSSLLTLVYTSLIRTCMEYCSATYFSAAPSHLKKLDIIQKIASRILTNSPQATHSAPLQSLLGLDSLNSRRRKHISKIVTNITSGRIHPYFHNIFTTNFTMSAPLSTNASSFASRSLNSKRFSQFAPLVVQEIDRKSTRLNSSHVRISYAVFCLTTNSAIRPP